MAIVLSEGRLTFCFPDDALVSQYDTWSFYRNQFNGCFGGTKAVDFVCVDAHPKVLNQRNIPVAMGWTVTG